MMPELGLYALIIAFCLTFFQFTIPLLGLYRHNTALKASAGPLSLGQGLFVTLGFLSLIYAFVQNDFTVVYVAENSNASLPLAYRIAAVWAGHEGSFLLWIFLLSIWTVLISLFSKSLSLELKTRILIILGIINFGFLLFLLSKSNPFLRFLPDYPLDGRDLNPLLQDPALIIHPPILYIGYVGLAIPFATAISFLWLNKVESAWLKWLRSWVLYSVSFLTLGIALGSWWAYYELGWGGWWFWDPVENASFMPLLVGIALIHSLMVSEKRGIYVGLTLFLALLGFSLSLLGTFLVRSGIVASIHAFANDPKRSIFLLQYLALIIGSAFLLYAVRCGSTVLHKSQKPSIFSREFLILVSVLLLVIACLSILFGTLFPLLYETLTKQKISVGLPYYNVVFIPIIMPVLLLIPVGPLLHWGQNSLMDFIKKIKWFLVIAIILSILLPLVLMTSFSLPVVIGLSLGLWIILGTFQVVLNKKKKRGGLAEITLGAWGMILAHCGVGILVIGVTVVSNFHLELDVRMKPSQSVDLGKYQVIFEKIDKKEGANYVGYVGHFSLYRKEYKMGDLYPEKRVYVIQETTLSEIAIEAGLFRDIYIALGEKLSNGDWSVKVYYKPFVRWIWFGAILIAVGGILSAIARRSRRDHG